MYQWRNGSVHRVDADKAGQELERIRDGYGSLLPEIVVDESRPEEAPLHPEFDWDDEHAATKWREHQARLVINGIRVVTATNDDGEAETTRPLYIHVITSQEPEGESQPRYVRVMDALADGRMRTEVLTRALNELEAWKRKYAELEELAAIFQASAVVREHMLVGAAV